jgi:hypothetical protein
VCSTRMSRKNSLTAFTRRLAFYRIYCPLGCHQ